MNYKNENQKIFEFFMAMISSAFWWLCFSLQ